MMNKFIIILLLAAGLIFFTEKISAPENIKPSTDIIVRPPSEVAIIEKPSTYLDEIKKFLAKDKTSDRSLGMGAYQCTHFTRDLGLNASKHAIPIGGIILGNDPDLKGYSNHAVNYIMIEDELYIINPESDYIVAWSDYLHKDRYKYYKLYPNTAILPTRWTGGLSDVHPTSEL